MTLWLLSIFRHSKLDSIFCHSELDSESHSVKKRNAESSSAFLFSSTLVNNYNFYRIPTFEI
jgi:hypothetical protein